jgi:hypothetical protein
VADDGAQRGQRTTISDLRRHVLSHGLKCFGQSRLDMTRHTDIFWCLLKPFWLVDVQDGGWRDLAFYICWAMHVGLCAVTVVGV